jgi:hypothetical protein
LVRGRGRAQWRLGAVSGGQFAIEPARYFPSTGPVRGYSERKAARWPGLQAPALNVPPTPTILSSHSILWPHLLQAERRFPEPIDPAALAHVRQGHQPPANIPVSPGTDIPKTMARAAPHARNRSQSFALMGTWRRPRGAAHPAVVEILIPDTVSAAVITHTKSHQDYETTRQPKCQATPSGPGLQDETLHFPFRHLHTPLWGPMFS